MTAFRKMLPLINPYSSGKSLDIPKDSELDFNTESSYQNILNLEKKRTALQPVPDRKANLEKIRPPIRDESIFPAFLSDPFARGLEKMVMVVYDEDGNAIGAVGESGISTMRDRIVGAYDRAGGNMSRFTELLEEMGLTVETYSNGEGPTYAESFEDIFGMKYSDVVNHNRMRFLS
ncbi:MAG: hypothetical protein GY739_11990 [Mesoflavibacter sp.]|nr:hypothetical protein [Mesoflavibacter sp.]